jgi:hypothetical protein
MAESPWEGVLGTYCLDVLLYQSPLVQPAALDAATNRLQILAAMGSAQGGIASSPAVATAASMAAAMARNGGGIGALTGPNAAANALQALSGAPPAAASSGGASQSQQPQQPQEPAFAVPAGMSLRALSRVLAAEKPEQASIVGTLASPACVSADELQQRKKQCLRLMHAGVFGDRWLVPMALAASCNANNEVADAGEDIARRLTLAGTAQERPEVVSALSDLVLGVVAPGGGAAISSGNQQQPQQAADARSPASMQLRLKAMALLQRSRFAASGSAVAVTPGTIGAAPDAAPTAPTVVVKAGANLPRTLRIVFECCFGASANAATAGTGASSTLVLRLQLAGIQFALTCFQLADEAALRTLAPLFLQGVLRLLNQFPAEDRSGSGDRDSSATEGNGSSQPQSQLLQAASDYLSDLTATAAAALAREEETRAAQKRTREAADRDRVREACYGALGALARRAPAPFRANLSVCQLLFARLTAEDPNQRLAVTEALGSLASVYRDSDSLSPTLRAELLRLLDSHCDHTDHRVRLVVVDWAIRCFPFADPAARLLCLRRRADERADVREAALAGMSPAKVRARRTVTSGAAATTAGSEILTAPRTGDAAANATERSGSDKETDAETEADAVDAEALAKDYPAFADMVSFLCASPAAAGAVHPAEDSGSRFLMLHPLGMAAALEFLSACLEANALAAGETVAQLFGKASQHIVSASAVATTGGVLPLRPSASGTTALELYRFLLESGLSLDANRADAATVYEISGLQLIRLLESDAGRAFAAHYATDVKLRWVLGWLKNPAPKVRAAMALLLGRASTLLPLEPKQTGAIAETSSDSASTFSVASLSEFLAAVIAGETRNIPLSGTAAALDGAALPAPVANATLAKVAAQISAQKATDAAGRDFRHGALLAMGHLLANVSKNTGGVLRADASQAPWVQQGIRALLSSLSLKDDSLRHAATLALTALARTRALFLPAVNPRWAQERTAALIHVVRSGSLASASTEQLALIDGGADNEVDALTSCRLGIVYQLFKLTTGTAPAAPASKAPSSSTASSEDKEESISTSRSTVIESAAMCLGALGSGEMSMATDEPGVTVEGCIAGVPIVTSAALYALVSLSIVRLESVQLTVGKALVETITAAAQSDKTLDASTRSNVSADDEKIAALNESAAQDQSRLPTYSAAEKASRDAAASWLLLHVLSTTLQSTKSQERAGAAMWLVLLVHAAGKAFSPIYNQLALLQSAFTKLLGERESMTQEIAAKGLALVYDCASSLPTAAASTDLRKQLVGALLNTFDSGRKVTMASLPEAAGGASPATDTTTAGPAGVALSTGGENAYKELCQLANESGQPDLLYQFLAIASHHSKWHTRGGAGLGLEALLQSRAKKELEPHLEKLIPRLYRYQYDPSEKVRDSMTRLWHVIVKDPRKAVAEHIQAILNECIVASQGDNWRERNAATLALNDALYGRSWKEIEPFLAQLWRATFRAIDDIKDSVRTAGEMLLKTLSRLTLRLCDQHHSSKSEGSAAASIVLPFLINEGLTHSIKDAVKQSLKLLKEISKVAGALLRPHIPDLMHTALTSLSAFEHQGLQTLQMHAAGATGIYGRDLDGEKLEMIRLAAASASPFADIVDRCLVQLREMPLAELDPQQLTLAADAEAGEGDDAPKAGIKRERPDEEAKGKTKAPSGILGQLVEKLRALIRTGLGLPTRGGTARLVSRLVTELGDRMKPHAMMLCRTLQACFDDSSPVLRKEFMNAAASLAKIMKSGTLKKLVERLFELARNGEDSSLRASAGFGLNALLSTSTERMKTFHSEAIPLAFLAIHDPEESVRTAWQSAWGELVPAGIHGLRLYAAEICTTVATTLDASSWVQKRQGAMAVVTLIRSLPKGEFIMVTGDEIASATLDALLEFTESAFRIDVSDPQSCRSSAILASEFGKHPGMPVDAVVGAFKRAAIERPAALRPLPCIEFMPHVDLLLPKLLSASGGQIWDGKESMLAALGEVVSRCPSHFHTPAGAELLDRAIVVLETQAQRASAPMSYTAVCVNALSAIYLAHPQICKATPAIATVNAVLTKYKRRAYGPALSANGSGDVASQTAASAGILGTKMNEEKESERREAEREKASEEASTAASALLLLSASLVERVYPRTAGSVSDEHSLSQAEQALEQFVSLAGAKAQVSDADIKQSSLAFASTCGFDSRTADESWQSAKDVLAFLVQTSFSVGDQKERTACYRAIGIAATKITDFSAAAAGKLLEVAQTCVAAAVNNDRQPRTRLAAAQAAGTCLQRLIGLQGSFSQCSATESKAALHASIQERVSCHDPKLRNLLDSLAVLISGM